MTERQLGAWFTVELWIKEVSRAEIKIRCRIGMILKTTDGTAENTVADHPFLWMVKVITTMFWQLKWKTWPSWKCTPVSCLPLLFYSIVGNTWKRKCPLEILFPMVGRKCHCLFFIFLLKYLLFSPKGFIFNLFFSSINASHIVQLGS